jgi:HTH-type transcriptional regulator/antitoxin HigA
MQIRIIKNDKQYQQTLKRVDKLFHASPGSKEQEELDILVLLIEKYETEKYGEFPDPDPIEAIKFKMEQMGMSQKDLAETIGLKSRASEILSRKRPMSIAIIRKLSKALSIPADILIQPYETSL